MVERKCFLLISHGPGLFTVRFCTSFLFSQLSFLTHYHHCFTVPQQKNAMMWITVGTDDWDNTMSVLWLQKYCKSVRAGIGN